MLVLVGQQHDLILLDLMLPGLSGEEVLAHIATSQDAATIHK